VTALLVALSAFSFLFGGGDAGGCARAEQQADVLVQRIRAEWPLRGSGDPVSIYIQGLGDRLARRAGLGSGWHFYVVRNLSPNAFALGAGHFVVNDGLFSLVRNESQLAAVLAHEMSHDRAGHFCRRPASHGEKFNVGSLTQTFDITREEEADAMAVDLLADAGFDPGAMESVLRCIARSAPRSSRGALRERIEALDRRGVRGRLGAVPDSRGVREARGEVLSDLPGDGGSEGSGRGCE
jgi:predicted Zn-dependent protease